MIGGRCGVRLSTRPASNMQPSGGRRQLGNAGAGTLSHDQNAHQPTFNTLRADASHGGYHTRQPATIPIPIEFDVVERGPKELRR